MKSPKPIPIDWTKYIEPKIQDFETKGKITIAVLLTKEEYETTNIR